MARASIGSVAERDVYALLRVLELDELTSSESLESRFKALIKRYHPDRNRDNSAWANDKTQELIEAVRLLRDHIEHHGPVLRRPQRQARATPAPPKPRRAPSSSFQMIEGRRINYALPIECIVKIVGVRDSCVHRAYPGPYCELDGELYPLHNLEGEDLRWDEASFVVLMRSPLLRAGIVLPREARFAGIEVFRLNEALSRNSAHRTHGLWIRHGTKYYLCPSEFIQPAAARSA